MEIISFSILINAPRQKVWHAMLDKSTYPEWTKAFHEGSAFEGNWEKGSEMRFIAPSADGKVEGMYSRIKENVLHEFISIEHVGMIKAGQIDTTSEEAKKWFPSFENYTFTEKDGNTAVKIDMQTLTEYKAMFEVMWPKALMALKELSEK
ncbi:hypothetical protein BH11BAC7_BH11BAC7_33280 [soil metagenome]